jgi:hypothetical protein
MAETKVCANCNTKNPAANNFCEQCGAKLTNASLSEKNTKSSSPVKVKESAATSNNEVAANYSKTSSAININLSSIWLPVLYGALLLLTVYTRFDHLGRSLIIMMKACMLSIHTSSLKTEIMNTIQ